jgi:hypothetical protein
MVIAEDAVKMLFIIKNTDVHLVVLELTLKWDYLQDGVKKLEQEEDKVPEEWDTWKIFLDWLKMVSELDLLLNLKKEKLNDKYRTIKNLL